VLVEEKLAERANKLGNYFKGELQSLQTNSNIIREVRGLGLMIGVEFRFDVLNILNKSMNKGVLILDAGRNILRFLPPLIIEKEHIDTVISVLDKVIKEEENERSGSPSDQNA
jgi:acetylornithine/succinyldiaminopimelate/putrescine aminotransferase